VDDYKVEYDKFFQKVRKMIHGKQLSGSFYKTNRYEGGSKFRALKRQISDDDIQKWLLSILNQMPKECAFDFLAELTAAWCLFSPKELVAEYHDDESISDVELADWLFSWVLRPFDFFP